VHPYADDGSGARTITSGAKAPDFGGRDARAKARAYPRCNGKNNSNDNGKKQIPFGDDNQKAMWRSSPKELCGSLYVCGSL
jgi:hypothetical protein